MKKYVIASILLISSLTSVAEDHFSGAFSIGAKGGVSLSQTTFSPSVPQKFHSGPMAGIMFRYIEENHFGLIGAGPLGCHRKSLQSTFLELFYNGGRPSVNGVGKNVKVF